jgi:hypothetical protein
MARIGKLAMLSGARRLAKANAGKVHSGIDKLAGAVKDRVGRRHEDEVDRGASWTKKALTGTDEHGRGRREPDSHTGSSGT